MEIPIDTTILCLHIVTFLARLSLIIENRITVYSKDRYPIDIERGATVLDFAFILNSEIGAHYKSAEVNGAYVDIDYVLQPNDTILIHKNDTPTARIEWFRVLETKTAINRLISLFSN